MARNKNKLERRKPSRDPYKKFFLVMEGKNTEPDYFDAYKEYLQARLIKVIPIPAAGDPGRISEESTRILNGRGLRGRKRVKLDSFAKNDEVWAIFDRDTHERYDDAKKACKKAGVNVAYSDPCFEHWINLHFDGHDAPYDHHQAQRICEKLLEGYDRKKRKSANFASIMQFCKNAEERAYRQFECRKKEGAHEGNPSTSVFNLTKAIREAHLKSKK